MKAIRTFSIFAGGAVPFIKGTTEGIEEGFNLLRKADVVRYSDNEVEEWYKIFENSIEQNIRKHNNPVACIIALARILEDAYFALSAIAAKNTMKSEDSV